MHYVMHRLDSLREMTLQTHLPHVYVPNVNLLRLLLGLDVVIYNRVIISVFL